jgi:hypothetical protein
MGLPSSLVGVNKAVTTAPTTVEMDGGIISTTFNVGGESIRKSRPPTNRTMFEPPRGTIIPGIGFASSSTPAFPNTSRNEADIA